MRLEGKVALITGGGGGIGATTARLFAREGARVVVADVNEAGVSRVVEEITSSEGSALGVMMDVADAGSVQAAVDRARDWGGRIDVLLNNAGITRDAGLLKMTEEQWDAVIAVNLKGVFLCGKAVAPVMVEQGSGSIINVSSVVGLYGNYGQTNYAATKAGVIGITRTWARELGPKGIRVNAVCPGFTATEMVLTVPENVLDGIRQKTPLRRLGDPEEIARTYLFLASDDASFVTGAVLSADGGLTL